VVITWGAEIDKNQPIIAFALEHTSGSVNGCAVGSYPTFPRVSFIGVSETCVSMLGLSDVHTCHM
jgi:hypothetical protein